MRDHAIHQLMRQQCIVHHQDPGPADSYGDHPLVELSATPERCYFAQATTTEDEAQLEVERWHLYLLPSTDIDANDEVTVAGMRLAVWGVPWRVVDPVTGYETHIEAVLMRRR